MEPSSEDYELGLIGDATRDEESPSPSSSSSSFVRVEFASADEAAMAGGPARLSVAGLLGRLGVGRFTLFLFVSLGLAFAADAFELLVLGFVLPALPVAGLTELWKTAVTSISFLGFGCGAFFWGVIADRFGRRRAYWIVLLTLIAFGYLQILSFNLALVVVWRFAMGFAVGGLGSAYALFAEFLPTHSRSLWLNLFQAWFALGSFLGALLACLMLDETTGAGSWQLVLVYGSIPSLLALICVPWLPASLRFLAMRKRSADLSRTVERMARWQRVKLEEGLTLVVSEPPAEKSSLRVIFEPDLRWTTIFLSLAWFSCSFCYYGIVLFSKVFFDNIGLSACRLTMITSVVEMLFLIGSGFLSIYVGRRVIVAGGFLLCALSTVGMGLAAQLHMPVGVVLVVSMASRGGASVAFAVMAMFTVELYPTRCRATGFGWCNSASRLAGILTPWIALPLLNRFGAWAPIAVYSIIAAGTALMVLFALKKETRKMDLKD